MAWGTGAASTRWEPVIRVDANKEKTQPHSDFNTDRNHEHGYVKIEEPHDVNIMVRCTRGAAPRSEYTGCNWIEFHLAVCLMQWLDKTRRHTQKSSPPHKRRTQKKESGEFVHIQFEPSPAIAGSSTVIAGLRTSVLSNPDGCLRQPLDL